MTAPAQGLFRRLVWRALGLEPGRAALALLSVALGVSVFLAVRLADRAAVASFEQFAQGVGTGARAWGSSGGTGDPGRGDLVRLEPLRRDAWIRPVLEGSFAPRGLAGRGEPGRPVQPGDRCRCWPRTWCGLTSRAPEAAGARRARRGSVARLRRTRGGAGRAWTGSWTRTGGAGEPGPGRSPWPRATPWPDEVDGLRGPAAGGGAAAGTRPTAAGAPRPPGHGPPGRPAAAPAPGPAGPPGSGLAAGAGRRPGPGPGPGSCPRAGPWRRPSTGPPAPAP